MMVLTLALILAQIGGTGVVTGRVLSPDGQPAPGVRVYAIPVGDAIEGARAATVLEGQAQTNSSGIYRLEIAPGRYYIAAGSVDVPTYFPGTTELAGARILSVAAGGTVSDIDFLRYTPPVQRPTLPFSIFQPTTGGPVSGTIRFPNGRPAASVYVTLVPNIPSALANPATPIFRVVKTDGAGHYQFGALEAGPYYIAAGFADAPTYYPGVADSMAAASVTVVISRPIDKLDFTIPETQAGTSVRGRVSTSGLSVSGATVVLRAVQSPLPPGISQVVRLPRRPELKAVVDSEGIFHFDDVPPGVYSAEFSMAGMSPILRDVVVSDQPVAGVDFSLPVAIVSGRVLKEDGSEFSDAQALRQFAASTVNNPNRITTTILRLDDAGRFSARLEAGEYRIYPLLLNSEYVVRSMKSGTTDLLTDTLRVAPNGSVSIDARLARHENVTADMPGVRIQGKLIDSVTRSPLNAERVELCCLVSTGAGRYSTRIAPDGSFEFSGVPPGHYSAGLRGPVALFLVDPTIDVDRSDLTGMTLEATTGSRKLSVVAHVMGGGVPQELRLSVTFTGTAGSTPLEIVRGRESTVTLPGDQYTVAVSGVPTGYRVTSLSSGTTDLLNGERLDVVGQPPGQGSWSSTSVVIVLAPSSR
jgi:hypothetical protein